MVLDYYDVHVTDTVYSRFKQFNNDMAAYSGCSDTLVQRWDSAGSLEPVFRHSHAVELGYAEN